LGAITTTFKFKSLSILEKYVANFMFELKQNQKSMLSHPSYYSFEDFGHLLIGYITTALNCFVTTKRGLVFKLAFESKFSTFIMALRKLEKKDNQNLIIQIIELKILQISQLYVGVYLIKLKY
jgi:hypothetical protein